MKKLTFLVLIISLISFASCNNDKKDKKTDAEKSEVTTGVLVIDMDADVAGGNIEKGWNISLNKIQPENAYEFTFKTDNGANTYTGEMTEIEVVEETDPEIREFSGKDGDGNLINLTYIYNDCGEYKGEVKVKFRSETYNGCGNLK